MKVEMSLRVLRLLLPVVRWTLKKIEKKETHSVHEIEQMKVLGQFLQVMKEP